MSAALPARRSEMYCKTVRIALLSIPNVFVKYMSTTNLSRASGYCTATSRDPTLQMTCPRSGSFRTTG
eukprot:3564945-Lingulodinium_polyedra.AAC.1